LNNNASANFVAFYLASKLLDLWRVFFHTKNSHLSTVRARNALPNLLFGGIAAWNKFRHDKLNVLLAM